MLFAGWEVRMVKNCDRGLENTARGRRPRAAFMLIILPYYIILPIIYTASIYLSV